MQKKKMFARLQVTRATQPARVGVINQGIHCFSTPVEVTANEDRNSCTWIGDATVH